MVELLNHTTSTLNAATNSLSTSTTSNLVSAGTTSTFVDPLWQRVNAASGFSASSPGVFTVGETGQVSLDYLFDGGTYQGDVAIFSLTETDGALQDGFESFARLAALRALLDRTQGHIVISDLTEGARFSGSLPYEENFNAGTYKGAKTFSMRPGDKFGIMLVPNGTVQEVLDNKLDGDHTPLFSIPSLNLGSVNQFAHVVNNIPTDGNTFAFEDLSLNGDSDKDYNDVVFQIKGATGNSPLLGSVVAPGKDWQNSQVGQQIEQFTVDPLDLAGNSIDKARKISLSSGGTTYRGWVGSTDLDDFYSFSLGATNKYQISLDGLGANANLELLDFKGNVIQRSNSLGTSPDFLNGTLSTGAYRVRVTSADKIGTAFSLSLKVTPQLQGITTTGSEAALYLSDDKSNQLIHADDNFRSGDKSRNSSPEFNGIDGKGQAIVIIDSGINSTHPFFENRIKYQQDFVSDDDTADDKTGHGTLVASIAAGKDPSGQYSGVAPGANIIALKAVDGTGKIIKYDDKGNPTDGDGRWTDVEQALQWVIENASYYNIVSVNMSFGTDSNYSQANSRPDLGINDELELLERRGIVVVASAGNNYERNSNPGLVYPAANPNVLAVGSVWDAFIPNPNPGSFSSLPLPKDSWLSKNGVAVIELTTAADQIAAFSQRLASKTMVFAPGVQVRGAGLNSTESSPNYIHVDSGTSMAAPHVAGAVALAQQLAMQEFPGRKPLTPEKFRELIYSTGKTIQEGNDDYRITLENVENQSKLKFSDIKNNVDLNGNPVQYKRADVLSLANGIMALRNPIRNPSDLKVDLSPARLDLAKSVVNIGDPITVNYQIKNTGLDTSPRFNVSFYLSNSTFFNLNDLRLGDPIPINSLAGRSSTGNRTQTFTLPKKDNSYWKGFVGLGGDGNVGTIYMRVDPDEAVKETNEDNNVGGSQLIQINQIPR